jgi:hypothetical protein
MLHKKFITIAVTAVAAATMLTGCATSTTSGSATSSASASSTGVKLPASFPKDVPLITGDVLVARGDADNGWSATVAPQSGKGFGKAEQALEAAGFTKQESSSSSQAVYQDDKYSVSISTPGSSVTYIISTR